MDPKEFKKLAAQLKLPAGGSFYGKSWVWNKRHGHAGAKTLERVREAARAAGWHPSPTTDNSTPDGSVVGRGRGFVSPEGHVLTTSSSYGATAYDNSFSINLKFVESPVGEGKTVKLTQAKLRQIISEAIWGARPNEFSDDEDDNDDEEMGMTEEQFAEELAEVTEEIDGVRNVRSYPSVGMMTNNAGFVVSMNDGTTFQITIVEGRRL